MFDIGLGELIVLAILALLVFGPDQLPKAAAQAGRFARQLREMATTARKELSDSAGIDDISSDLKSLADLHPRKLAASVFNDSDSDTSSRKSAAAQTGTGQERIEPPQAAPAPPSSDSPAAPAKPQAFDPDAT